MRKSSWNAKYEVTAADEGAAVEAAVYPVYGARAGSTRQAEDGGRQLLWEDQDEHMNFSAMKSLSNFGHSRSLYFAYLGHFLNIFPFTSLPCGRFRDDEDEDEDEDETDEGLVVGLGLQ